MRKVIVFAFILILFGVALVVSCSDNGTEPNGNGDSDTLDEVSPYIRSSYPPDGATGVYRGTSLYVSICDTGEFASGVEPDSISMKVDDTPVEPLLITNGCDGYDLEYLPPEEFEYAGTVTVQIDVVDFAGNRLNASSSFTVEIGDTFSFSIDTISPLGGFVTRSKPDGFTLQALYFPSPGPSYSALDVGMPYSVSTTPGRSWILTDPYPDGDIFAVNPNLSLKIALTDNPAEENYPALSPNGYTLAFARGEDVVLKNLFNGTEEILASSAHGGRNLAFSHDGEYLAYMSGSGSVNPDLFVWRLRDRERIDPSAFNDVDCYDWANSSSEIAVAIGGGRLYRWNADDGGYPHLLHDGDNLEHVVCSGDFIYFVERLPAGDIIRSADMSDIVWNVLDLTPEAATVEAMGASDDMELVFAKRAGTTYSLVYLDADGGTPETLTASIGQTIEIYWQ